MKVALVSEHASPLAALGGADAGGQNVHVGALARELVRQGHSVVVHTRRDDPSLPRRLAVGGVIIDHVDAGPPTALPKDELLPWMGDFAADLQTVWQKQRPDVVHAHFWMSGLAAAQAARPLGIPVIETFHALGSVKRRHQGDADTSPPDRIPIERWLLQAVDRVIATCGDEVHELSRLGARQESISVIPCGVDRSTFNPCGASWPRHRTHRLAAVGRLVKRKGVADAIESLHWLPDTELVVAGGPPAEELAADPEAKRLAEVALRADVSERVKLVGQVSRRDVPGLLRSADAVVSVPYYEPFGIVPIEAMACGVPAVVSRVGGLQESVVDGVTGCHVPADDPRTLAEVLSGLLADPQRCHRLARAGIQRAERYDWRHVTAQTVAVYEEVATRTPVMTVAGSP